MKKITQVIVVAVLINFFGFSNLEAPITYASSASCVSPSSLGDDQVDDLFPGPEVPLQQVLDGYGYGINTAAGDTQSQVWNIEANSTVTIDFKNLGDYAVYRSVFGYYVSGDTSTFVPLFKNSDIPGYGSVPFFATNDSGTATIETTDATSISFAIKSFNDGVFRDYYTSENDLNPTGGDQFFSYVSGDKDILAFEDLTDGDFDYNDVMVELTMNCGAPTTPAPGTVQVNKIIDADGNLETTSDQTPGAGFAFTSSWWDGSILTNLNGETGIFEVPPSLNSITEVEKDGYDLIGGSCAGSSTYGQFDNATNSIIGINIFSDQNAVCTFYNKPTAVTPPANLAPVADAGPDQIITLPTNSVNLDGSGSTDSDGTITSYVWSFDSETGTFNPADTALSSIGSLTAGTYTFTLTVTDNDGATDTDTVKITVNPAIVVGHTPQCSDGVDNSDPEDTLADTQDPGCHTDGNAGNPDTYNPNDNDETDVATTPVTNACPLPDSMGDTTVETIIVGPENTLQNILNNAGYTLNVSSNQKQYQVWNLSAGNTAVISTKFIDAISAHQAVFGYYTNGSMTNFVPIFKTTDIAGYESVPLSNTGPFGLQAISATSIGFAIKTFDGTDSAGNFATENSLNSSSADQVIAFNPGANKYVLAFEDLTNGDFDYNDLVVEITLGCETAGAQNLAPVADAGLDQVITLPTNSVNLNGSGSHDDDGTIVSYVWDEVSGPSGVNPADTITAPAGSLVAGTYIFKLTVTDNDGATDDDLVQITVNPASGGGHTPECSDGVDNSDPEDTLADTQDPGCHTDGNAGNPSSYNPQDDNETNNPQCSDGIDNDDDNKIDANDPGCHSDGNPNNPDTYNPNDNDETDAESPTDVCPNIEGLQTSVPAGFRKTSNGQCVHKSSGGGGGGRVGGSINPPVGQVLGEETSCGIYVEKFLRVGYQNDVAAVVKVQSFLNTYMDAGLAIDGIYGVKTEAAVRKFQLAREEKVLTPWGISASTGIFYLTTQTEVNNIMCPPLNLPIPQPLVNWSTALGPVNNSPN